MIGATVCSGIGAPEVAMPWVDWRFAAEIDPAARAVYAHRHPAVELMGDFTAMKDDPRIADVELLVGGTPCQAFSVAGLRQSLSDDRGNLSLEFIRLANAIDDLRRAAGRPDAFILWENVPGVLSVSDNAFGAFLGGLVGSDAPIVPSGRWTNSGVVAGPRRVAAWRILDAQFFGVPQRRRRIFVLAHGHSRGWACADALLSIRHSLQGHPPPRREKGQVAPTVPSRSTGGGGLGTDFDCDGGLIAFGENDTRGPIDVATAVNAHGGPCGRMDFESETFIAQTLSFTGGASECISLKDCAHPVTGRNGDPGMVAVAFTASEQANSYAWERDVYPTLNAQVPNDSSNIQQGIRLGSAVRRLTPRECERLQGFPDDFTLVPHRGKPMADGPRYKMLGNSMAVPVVRWIGERIAAVEAIAEKKAAA